MSRGILENEKTSTEGRRSVCTRSCMAVIVTLVAASSLAMFIVFWCTNVFRDSILSNLEIKNGTPMFDWWQRPPVRPAYKIRIFNYTNVDDFMSGKTDKLRLNEVGPYIYRETLVRIDPTVNEDGTVSYREKRSFEWEGGRPDDEIIRVPNVPLLAATAFARDLGFVTRVTLTAILTTVQSKAFIDVSAGGFLWGYDDKIFELAKPFIALQEQIPFDRFGVLAVKSGLSKDRMTIKTGVSDINEVGIITKLNGMESRKVWGDEKCDKIEGTDGTMFPPNLFENTNATLKVYARDLCRPLSLSFHGHGNVHGIPTLTYKPPIDVLTSSATKDSCYCAKSAPGSDNSAVSCPPAGIFNSSACNFNMPFLASFPHFYGGDRKLLDHVDGLDPLAELHGSSVEIHPRLGVPIGGHSRIQVNIEARKAVGVPFLGKLKDGTILPLVWIEVTLDKMPDSVLNVLHHAYFTARAVEAFMQWASIVGIVFSICSVIFMLK